MMKKLVISFGFFLVAFSTKIAASSPHLLIKIPTRQRPIKFFNTLDDYYKKLSGKVAYSFLISCDTNDATMNNDEIITKLKSYPNLFFYFGDNKSKVEAYNADIDKHMNFDLLLVASDDTQPTYNYDQVIVEIMVNRFPDFDGVLNFSDGHQKANLNTLPVIGKKFYDRFGYVYCPEYKSLYCDEELTLISKILQKEVYDPRVIILHIHPDFGMIPYDDLYCHNATFVGRDQALFQKRKSAGFYLH